MKKILHAGHAFVAFCNAVESIKKATQYKVSVICDYSQDTVHARFIQRLVTLTLFPYIRKAYKQVEVEGDIVDSGKLGLSEVVIDTSSGGIRFTAFQCLRSIAEYGYEWSIILKSLFYRLCYLKNDKISEAVTLVYGVGGESIKFEGQDDRFVKYCKEGPITPLSEAKIRLIQSSFKELNKEREFFYVEKPLHALLERADLSFFEYWLCFVGHLLNPFYYFFAIMKSPLAIILGRDIAYCSVVKVLASKKLIKDIVLTNTNYTDQYLWMRNSKNYGFKVHYINYSQNNRPLGYIDDDFVAHHPNIFHIAADVQWVWTAGYREYLQSINFKGEIKVIGAIMFYLPEDPKLPMKNDVFKIALFDVTPIYEHVAANIGIINNYYNGSTLIKFLSDIVELCEELSFNSGIKIEIVLKHKRHFNKNHDVSYIDLCNKMANEDKIKTIDYDTNIFSFINSSDLTISIPYTSSAYVATSMGCHSIYYDGAAVLSNDCEENQLLKMCVGRNELRIAIQHQLKEWSLTS